MTNMDELGMYYYNGHHNYLIFQRPNDKARLYTPSLEPGKYSIQLFFHSSGDGPGGLSIYTREDNSPYAQLVWYYSKKFNGTYSDWTEARVEVNQVSSFKVSFWHCKD